MFSIIHLPTGFQMVTGISSSDLLPANQSDESLSVYILGQLYSKISGFKYTGDIPSVTSEFALSLNFSQVSQPSRAEILRILLV